MLVDTLYDQYALEAANTNAGTIELYEKLGFGEFMCIEQKHGDKSGVNALVYMGVKPG